MRYYKITDDCGFEHFVCVLDITCVMLAPHVRKAERIAREDYEEHRKIKCERRENIERIQ